MLLRNPYDMEKGGGYVIVSRKEKTKAAMRSNRGRYSLVVMAVRLICSTGCAAEVFTIGRGIGVPHRALGLVHVASFLLVVRVGGAVDVCQWDRVGSGVVVSIGRLDAGVASSTLLRLHASASVEKTALGETELCGGSLLVADVVRIGLSGAAAAAEEPEHGGEEDEGSSEPSHSEHVCRKADCDVVILELFVQGRDKDAEHDRCGDGATKDEDGRDDGANPGEEAAETRADCEYTEDDGDNQGPQAGEVGGEHPLAQLLVQID